jgi:hypothetical protein
MVDVKSDPVLFPVIVVVPTTPLAAVVVVFEGALAQLRPVRVSILGVTTLPVRVVLTQPLSGQLLTSALYGTVIGRPMI